LNGLVANSENFTLIYAKRSAKDTLIGCLAYTDPYSLDVQLILFKNESSFPVSRQRFSLLQNGGVAYNSLSIPSELAIISPARGCQTVLNLGSLTFVCWVKQTNDKDQIHFVAAENENIWLCYLNLASRSVDRVVKYQNIEFHADLNTYDIQCVAVTSDRQLVV